MFAFFRLLIDLGSLLMSLCRLFFSFKEKKEEKEKKEKKEEQEKKEKKEKKPQKEKGQKFWVTQSGSHLHSAGGCQSGSHAVTWCGHCNELV